MKRDIVYIANVPVTPVTGMGRISFEWKKAFERNGHNFFSLIPSEKIKKNVHPSLLPFIALSLFLKNRAKYHQPILIVHEPLSGIFTFLKYPVLVISHGIEQRNWQMIKNDQYEKTSIRTKILFPIWSLVWSRLGLRKSSLNLLSNQDDKKYVMDNFHRNNDDIYCFKNGAYNIPGEILNNGQINTIVFEGSWLKRKGIVTLIEAAKILKKNSIPVKWLIIGAGKPKKDIIKCWPNELHQDVTIVEKFEQDEEINLLTHGLIYVLPSFFEGQPLSLLQAMAAGRCCIATNSCGQKDLIQDQINGFLFETGDSKKLSELIEKCIKNPENTRKIGRNAIKSVADRDWERVTDELVNFIDHRFQ